MSLETSIVFRCKARRIRTVRITFVEMWSFSSDDLSFFLSFLFFFFSFYCWINVRQTRLVWRKWEEGNMYVARIFSAGNIISRLLSVKWNRFMLLWSVQDWCSTSIKSLRSTNEKNNARNEEVAQVTVNYAVFSNRKRSRTSIETRDERISVRLFPISVRTRLETEDEHSGESIHRRWRKNEIRSLTRIMGHEKEKECQTKKKKKEQKKIETACTCNKNKRRNR